MTQAQADALEWIKQVQSDFADMQVEVSARWSSPARPRCAEHRLGRVQRPAGEMPHLR